jgi:hypothetical protein
MHDVCRNPEQMRDGVETSHAALNQWMVGRRLMMVLVENSHSSGTGTVIGHRGAHLSLYAVR